MALRAGCTAGCLWAMVAGCAAISEGRRDTAGERVPKSLTNTVTRSCRPRSARFNSVVWVKKGGSWKGAVGAVAPVIEQKQYGEAGTRRDEALAR